MNKLFRKESIIGACVLIALAILFFGIEYLKGVSIFKPSNYYYAVYTDVEGLSVSAPVTVNGFKIGQVDDVELMYDNPGHILVAFSIDKKFKLPLQSKAMIASDLLGTASVKIELAPGTTFYQPGDTVPSAVASGLMGEVTDKLLPGVGEILPKVDTLLTSINNVVGDPAILASVQRLDAISASLQSTMGQLNRSVSKFPEIMNDITSITSSVKTLADDMTSLSSTMADAPIDSMINNLYKTSADLNQLTAQLNDPNSTIGQLLNDSGLYDNLRQATADLDSLFVDIKRNPKRYISIKLL